jgi:hypothetical protein
MEFFPMLDTKLMEERLNDLNRFHDDYFDDPVVLVVLKCRGVIAQLYPVNRRDKHIRPIFGLMVPLETALSCMRREFWSDITMTELKNFLARNDILASTNINDFVRMKEARHKEAALRKATENVD